MKKPTTKKGWLGLGCGGALVLLVLCGVLSMATGTRTQEAGQQVAPVAASGATAAPAATEAPAAPDATDVPTEVPPTAEPTEVPATPVPAIGAVGEPREAGGVTLTVAGVSRAAELSTYQKAEAGKEYVLAEVMIETTGRDTAPYNPFYFKVKDGDGYEYSIALNTGDNALKSGDLAQGDKVRGVVAFEVPAGVTGLILNYEPIVIAGGFDPIRIALD